MFLSMLEKYELISRKGVHGKITIMIQKDQWLKFTLEYELSNVEINKYQLDTLIEK